MNNFARKYNERSLFEKLKKYAQKAGQQVVYAVLLLWYVMKDPAVASKTKLTVAAALGYFILPTDFIFDLIPIVGYTDDLGVLIYALIKVSSCVTPEMRLKARLKLKEWFRNTEESQLLMLDKKIGKNFGNGDI